MALAETFSYSHTLRGAAHAQLGTPCEDSSADTVARPSEARIIAVADGHGDPAAFRSATGARFATQAAAESLSTFANKLDSPIDESRSLRQELAIPSHRERVARRLVESVLARWHQRIREDVAAHPFTAEELRGAGRGDDFYRQEENVARAYGTTLIAGVWAPPHILLVQQGDGHCAVIGGDGSMSHPIPWDSRCSGSITTSLSDPDAVRSFRHALIDTQAESVCGVVMGTDGISDSFGDLAGTDTFYKELSLTLLDHCEDAQADLYVVPKLQEITSDGSGDDVSVAALIDPERLAPLVGRLRQDLASYADDLRATEANRRVESLRAKLDALQPQVESSLRQMWQGRTTSAQELQTLLNYNETYEQYREESRIAQDEGPERTGD